MTKLVRGGRNNSTSRIPFMCCEDSTCEFTRRELVTILLESQEHLFTRKFDHLLTRLIELTNCPDDGVKILKKKLKGFKNKFTSKLRDVHSITEKFLHDNENWLTTSVTFPLWRRNELGRPRRSFKACAESTKRRKAGELLKTLPKDLVLRASKIITPSVPATSSAAQAGRSTRVVAHCDRFQY